MATALRPACRALDDASLDDALAVPEPLAGQIDLDAAGQPIPSVESLLPAVGGVDLPEHEIAAEQLLTTSAVMSQ